MPNVRKQGSPQRHAGTEQKRRVLNLIFFSVCPCLCADYLLQMVISDTDFCGRVVYHDVVVGEYLVDLWVEDVLLVELKTVKALDDAHMPRVIDPGIRCAGAITPKRTAGGSACCLISANPAWRSNAWSTACEPRWTICIANLKNPLGLRRFCQAASLVRASVLTNFAVINAVTTIRPCTVRW